VDGNRINRDGDEFGQSPGVNAEQGVANGESIDIVAECRDRPANWSPATRCFGVRMPYEGRAM
jgi:hypothetical protein